MAHRIARADYAAMYGPTTGDRVRLGDTDLIIEVERDLTTYGGQMPRSGGTVDTVITNALIVDWTGIYKADVGLRDGLIHAIGKAGNPDTQPGVTIIIGPGTEVIAGEGRILTAGGIDAHIHFIAHRSGPDRGCAAFRHHHDAGRRHRPGAWDAGDDLHARPLAHRADAAGAGHLPDQLRSVW